MADACRSAISAWWKLDKNGDNAGLMRDRFLRVTVKDKKNHPQARRELFEAMRQSLVQSRGTYGAGYQRQESMFWNLKSKGIFRTHGRMIIGLGGENVLETGLTLNHTYGTPLIPGSALKGLAAHYCDQAWGAADDKFKLSGEYHKTIFGTTEDSGHIIFHDAWITPDSLEGSLQLDVMTPHHGDYYSDETGSTAPTDFDDPNPVTFLSIVGTFQVAVSCDVPGPIGDEWAMRVFELLSDALQEWGIGGKTNAGYGRMIREGLDEGGSQPSIPAESSALTSPEGAVPQKPTKSTIPAGKPPVKRLKYKKGDTVEVTRIADPKEKRGAAYFMADDGIGGMVVQGAVPSVEMGKKIKLVIAGVMEKEGLYNFAAPGERKDSGRHMKDRRR